MKLYVWEKFRCDYTCGMAVAVAHDLGEAIMLVTDTAPFHHWSNDELTSAKEYDLGEPVAFSCAGGG